MFEKEALNILADRRRLETVRIEELSDRLKADPQYRLALTELNVSRFEYSKAIAQKRDVSVAENRFKVAQTVYDAYLTNHGYAVDVLNEKPACPICNDTGIADGKSCSCLRAIVKNLAATQGDAPHGESDFSKFDLALYAGEDKQNSQNVLAFVQKWTAMYPAVNTKILTLYGQTGVGKTYLAGIVANRFIDQGFRVCFLKAFHLNDLFLAARLAPLAEKRRMLAEVYDCDLLVIDDLGAEEPYQNVTLEYLYTTIAEREKAATIITTNLSPSMLKDRYQERIYSRLVGGGGTVVPLNGNDLRVNNK